jgi:hypothetical protein
MAVYTLVQIHKSTLILPVFFHITHTRTYKHTNWAVYSEYKRSFLTELHVIQLQIQVSSETERGRAKNMPVTEENYQSKWYYSNVNRIRCCKLTTRPPNRTGDIRPEDVGSQHLRNVGKFLSDKRA